MLHRSKLLELSQMNIKRNLAGAPDRSAPRVRGIALALLRTWNIFRIMITRFATHLLVIFGIVLLLAGCAARPDTTAAYDDVHSAQITDEVPTTSGRKIPVTTVHGP
jgi:hypothetical protein